MTQTYGVNWRVKTDSESASLNLHHALLELGDFLSEFCSFTENATTSNQIHVKYSILPTTNQDLSTTQRVSNNVREETNVLEFGKDDDPSSIGFKKTKNHIIQLNKEEVALPQTKPSSTENKPVEIELRGPNVTPCTMRGHTNCHTVTETRWQTSYVFIVKCHNKQRISFLRNRLNGTSNIIISKLEIKLRDLKQHYALKANFQHFPLTTTTLSDEILENQAVTRLLINATLSSDDPAKKRNMTFDLLRDSISDHNPSPFIHLVKHFQRYITYDKVITQAREVLESNPTHNNSSTILSFF